MWRSQPQTHLGSNKRNGKRYFNEEMQLHAHTHTYNIHWYRYNVKPTDRPTNIQSSARCIKKKNWNSNTINHNLFELFQMKNYSFSVLLCSLHIFCRGFSVCVCFVFVWFFFDFSCSICVSCSSLISFVVIFLPLNLTVGNGFVRLANIWYDRTKARAYIHINWIPSGMKETKKKGLHHIVVITVWLIRLV